MERRHLNIILDGDLATHLDRRVQGDGAFRSADDYVGELIRRDMVEDTDMAQFLDDLLSEALADDDQSFRSVEAADVLRRNAKS